MKSRLLSACALAACLGGAAAFAPADANATALRAQGQADKDAKQQGPKVSRDEAKAVEKIEKAQGAEAKLQAAAEFLKKYPQSALRAQIADYVAGQVSAVTDAQSLVSLSETYRIIFNQPNEADLINRTLLAAYINANRTDDAFKASTAYLAGNPEDVDILKNLTVLAANDALRGRTTYLQQGREHSRRAIELIEADKRPANIEEAQWPNYKTTTLPVLYQLAGILAERAGDKQAARSHLERAVALKSSDPNVFLALINLATAEYELLSLKYRASEGDARAAALKDVENQVDQLIELYAQAVAAMERDERFRQAIPQVMQEFESNYKFRHNGSTEGMRQLIDKYKQTMASN